MTDDGIKVQRAGGHARISRELTPFAPAITPESLSPDDLTRINISKKRSYPEDDAQSSNDRKRLLGSNMLKHAKENESNEARPVIDVTITRKARSKLVAGSNKEAEKANAKAWKDVFRPALVTLGLSRRQIGPKGDNTWHSAGMTTGLHPHQVLGAAWMYETETANNGRVGGILASDMGLGKTITTLAMMVRNPAPKGSPKATLIVTRNEDLMKQWMAEIIKHVKKKHRKVILCFRGKTHQDIRSLQKIDFVITTYNDVSASYPKNNPPEDIKKAGGEQLRSWWENKLRSKGMLHQCKFHRVVLDEAHTIKNHTSQVSVACCALDSTYRWAMSGTPIQNRIDELFPLLRFIKAPDVDKLRTFKQKYCRENEEATTNLDALLGIVMHRITHGDKVMGRKPVDLPKTHQEIIFLVLDPISQYIYKMLKDKYYARIRSFKTSGTDATKKKKRNCELDLLTKLRQFTADISLIKDDLMNLLTAADITRLRAIAHSSVNKDKLKVFVDYVERLALGRPRKPEDIHQHGGRIVSSSTMIKHEDLQDDEGGVLLDRMDPGSQVTPLSGKVEAVLNLIERWTSEAPKEKVIVFTEWLMMIAIIARACAVRGLAVRKYHGKMSALGRSSALGAFQDDSKVRVLIASTKCGGIGLNLTSANRMISIDAWWNACVEDQAFGRIYRMGQTREVHFTRFAIRDTIDEKLLAMQERKSAQIDRAVRKSESSDNFDDETLETLFEEYMTEDEGGLFAGECDHDTSARSPGDETVAVPQESSEEEEESCEERSESDSDGSADDEEFDTNSAALDLQDVDYHPMNAAYESGNDE